LFVDSLEDYDVRKVHDTIAREAADINTLARDADQQLDTYLEEGGKKPVKYEYDETSDIYVPR